MKANGAPSAPVVIKFYMLRIRVLYVHVLSFSDRCRGGYSCFASSVLLLHGYIGLKKSFLHIFC